MTNKYTHKYTNKQTYKATSRTRAPSGAIIEKCRHGGRTMSAGLGSTLWKNETGHGQKAAALWPNTTYTKFGGIDMLQENK